MNLSPSNVAVWLTTKNSVVTEKQITHIWALQVHLCFQARRCRWSVFRDEVDYIVCRFILISCPWPCHQMFRFSCQYYVCISEIRLSLSNCCYNLHAERPIYLFRICVLISLSNTDKCIRITKSPLYEGYTSNMFQRLMRQGVRLIHLAASYTK